MKDKKIEKNILITVTATIGAISLLGFGACQNLMLDDEFETKGGIRLVLQVATVEAINQELDQDARSISRMLKSKDIAFNSSRRGNGLFIEVKGMDSSGEDEVNNLLDTTYDKNYEIQSRLTEEKTEFTLTLRESEILNMRETTVLRTMGTIRRRMYELGISKPRVRPLDENNQRNQDQLIVEFPNTNDPDRIKALLVGSAQFKLHLVHKEYSETFPSIESVINMMENIPEDYQLLQYKDNGQNAPLQFILVQMESVITGKDLKQARRSIDQNGNPSVSFLLTEEGAKLFEEVTSEHIGERLAIVLDDMVYSAPTIQSRIGAEGIITGSFTEQEAEDLALLLRSGALPASLKILQEIWVPPVEKKERANVI